MSAVYLPRSDAPLAGSDWYDVYELPDGRFAFSVGDVAGRSAAAADVMGEIRRAFAASAGPVLPSLVLDRANEILGARSDLTIATAIFGILDPVSSSVTYAVAGHPPPLIATRCGTAHALPARGIPLGVDGSVGAQDWTFTLPPGSLFALYTDGLIGHSHDVIAGEDELTEAVRHQISSPSDAPAQTIVARVFAERTNEDEVAALVLSVPDLVPERFVFDFTALPLAVPLLRRALAHFADALGARPDARHALLTAVGEAAANAVEHAYVDASPGIVRVRAARAGDELVVDVNDEGRWKKAERRDERGRGITIMRALMDDIEIRTTGANTTVRLKMHLPNEPD